MNHITTEQLEAIRKRAEKATEGPWRRALYRVYGGDMNYTMADPPRTDDADFIAHAREDIPLLLAEVERYKEVERKLRIITDKAYVTSDSQLFTMIRAIKDALYGGDTQ